VTARFIVWCSFHLHGHLHRTGEARELEWWLVGSSDRKVGHEWLRFGVPAHPVVHSHGSADRILPSAI
jgi:hypothetical protein